MPEAASATPTSTPPCEQYDGCDTDYPVEMCAYQGVAHSDFDWQELGPKLEGKIHVYCGDMDNYYLNNAVYLMEDFLESTTNPYYGGEVDYGDRAEHCWNGDQENSNAISRLRYNTMYLPKIKRRIEATAPKDAPLVNWR